MMRMRPRSVKSARIFGLIMILMVSAWDMDAMRPHIAARSWYTLAFVALFLIVHVSDYLTIGRLVTRIDPLVMANFNAMTSNEARTQASLLLSETLPQRRLAQYGWRRFFPFDRRRPNRPGAKLYTFTAVHAAAAQASGAPYSVAQKHFIVKPE